MLDEPCKAIVGGGLLSKLGDVVLSQIAEVLNKKELAAFFDAMRNPCGYTPLTPARVRQVLPMLHLTPESRKAVEAIDPSLFSSG